MERFTGSCLCRTITYKSKSDPLKTFNCHCEDCRKCSGAPYLTNIFVKEGDLYIQGERESLTMQLCFGKKCKASTLLDIESFNDVLMSLYEPLLKNTN